MCMYPQVVPSWKKVFIPSDENGRGTQVSGGTIHNAKDWTNLEERECGKCPDCLRKRSIQWCFRLGKENEQSFTSQFLTLTYADEHLPKGGLLNKRDMQLFWKNLRRQIDYLYDGDDPSFEKYGKNQWIVEDQYHRMKEAHWFKERRLKYYEIGEYGTQFGRPHYHAIAYNIPKPLIKKLPKIWGNGIVKVGTVTPKSIRYVANYVLQIDRNKPQPEREYSTPSNGLGIDYAINNESFHRKKLSGSVQYNGAEIPMPQYYRKKFYTNEEAALLAERNQESKAERDAELLAELKQKGIEYEDYLREQRRIKWNQYYNHRKRRKL